MKQLLKYTSVQKSEDSSFDAESGKECLTKGFLARKSTKAKKLSIEEEITSKLHLAVWPKFDIEVFLLLLEQHPEELNKQFGPLKDTPLHRAVRHGQIKAAKILIEKKANIDAQNLYGQTPLHIACQLQRADIAQMLADAGADVNLGDVSGDAPIHLACKGGSIHILKLVMEKSLCKMGCEGHLGNSLLHYAAQYGHVEMMKYLLDNENDPNARNYLSETPLHLAAGAYLAKVGTKHIELLLERGANLNLRTEWGDNAAHYAALGGSQEVLVYLCDQGISLTKPKSSKATKILCEKYGLSEETCEEMDMSFLQKVARSTCINKSNFVLNNIMKARRIMAYNQSAAYLQSSRNLLYRHTEMSEQQKEFKMMAHELHQDMNKPNSALRLFLKYAPDCIDHLLNECLVSFCGSDQVQGKISFDFFLFHPPEVFDSSNEQMGELTMFKILMESRKERLLTHPLFETFLKLKWYRTWKIYMLILIFYGLFVSAVLGYALTHFGNVLEKRLDPNERDFWWYFLATASSCVGTVEVVKLLHIMLECAKLTKARWEFLAKDTSLACSLLMDKVKQVAIPVLSILMLCSFLETETRRYISAIAVILSCFSFMLVLSRLPRIGIYIFMLNKVFLTIMNFFVSYFWHFLGYAIAFHILMPDEGPFENLGDSIIKVLTMLMGEYDFTDNFANDQTFWLTKLIFVIFVIDMSVVLMNLVLGLAVNDVDSILQDSKVRRMVHETLTIVYLEKLCINLSKLSWFQDAIIRLRITNSNICHFKEVVYLNLVDTVHNEGNEIVIDRAMMGGDKTSHPCPDTVAQSVVAILKARLITSSPKPHRKTEQIVSELKEQNAVLTQKVENMQGQLAAILKLLNEKHKDA